MRDLDALEQRRAQLAGEIDDVEDRLGIWPGAELRLIRDRLVRQLNEIDLKIEATKREAAA